MSAFSGAIRPTKTGPLYSAGLAVVAFAMVLLPLIYMGLIVLATWAVYLHLKNDTWIMGGSGRGGFMRLVLYLGPAVAGAILIFFMVKPFFAAKAKPPEPITADPANEPLLFAFVRKICQLVGAPVPCRVDVDCQVNASASLRRGFWSKDLVLTIGLPLVSGLDMRQFAGVLAHEFGHFAQGAGMRLTYIIRNINFWFARVVYERDEWDLKLDHAARNTDLRIGIVLHAARACVWVTRRILWVLMHTGNAISCFMMRQMEFDADSYEAKIAGSDAFESTAQRLRVLSVATQSAYADVEQSWASKRLPENLPLLIGHKAGSLPPEIRQKLSTAADSEKTRWFDTHPCDAERVLAARRLNEPGVFRVSEPATGLFSDFAALSKTVTRHQYEKQMELEFTDENLMGAEEILRESEANAQAEALVGKYYGGVNLSLRPLLTSGELPALAEGQPAIEGCRRAKEMMDKLRAAAEQKSSECVELQNRFIDLNAAAWLAKAGFKIQPKEFGLPETATSAGEQETAARVAHRQASAALAEHLAELESFMAALRERVTLGIQLQASVKASAAGGPEETANLVRMLAAVSREMSQVHEMGSKLKAFVLLAQNRGNHSDPARVDRVIAELSAEFQAAVSGIQARLANFTYPFPHARAPLTVADYARLEKPEENELVRPYLEANAHVERLFALHYRLVGRILACAEAGEKKLEE